jgi:DNA-binding beta-propeller fold protein YncE
MGPHRAALVIASIALGVGCAGCAGGSPAAHVAGRPPSPATSPATIVSRRAPACTSSVQSAPALPASATAMTTLSPPSSPFGVAVTAGGRWAFASLGSDLAVLQMSAGHAPRLVKTIPLPQPAVAGVALSPDGRLLLVADEGAGAVVVSVTAAELGGPQAVLGTLATPGGNGGGAIEVAVSPDDRYAFVSLETADQIAVFNLAKALASGFGPDAYVGSIPTQIAPVGLAFSPDGRWLYSTSEGQSRATESGTLAMISVSRAESDPGGSVVARVTAGCSPVRVITSADGSVVWVTARASDALLAFSATRLRADPTGALLADVPVGESPVGLALVRDGTVLIVADSDRFNAAGQHASLAVVDVADALAAKPALLGYLPAGGFPRDVAAGPGGAMLLVANYLSHQLEAVNVAALPVATHP